jgi:hypothetical protein
VALKPENPVVGGTVLRRAAIQSPNYVPGTSGWAVFQDGSAEFNNVTLRGELIVGTGPQVVIDETGGVGTISLPTGDASEAAPAGINSGVSGTVLVAFFAGATSTGAADSVYIELESNNSGGSSSALGVLFYKDTAAVAHDCLQWDSAGVHIGVTLFGGGGTLTIGDAVVINNTLKVTGNVNMDTSTIDVANGNINLNMASPPHYPLTTSGGTTQVNNIALCLNGLIQSMINRQLIA